MVPFNKSLSSLLFLKIFSWIQILEHCIFWKNLSPTPTCREGNVQGRSSGRGKVLLSDSKKLQDRINRKNMYAVAAAKSLQSCPTPCDPIDSSPPGSSVPGILQARILEWVAISFSKKYVYVNLNNIEPIKYEYCHMRFNFFFSLFYCFGFVLFGFFIYFY